MTSPPSKAKAQDYLNGWRQVVADSGFVEGLNNKLKVIKRRCYGLFNPGHLFQPIQIDLEGERLLSGI